MKNVLTSIRASISKGMLNLKSVKEMLAEMLNYDLGMKRLDRISIRLMTNDKSKLLILDHMVHERFFLFLM